MSLTAVDHLVVAAATLEEGARWCEAVLGVEPGPIGKHPLMSTHNRVLSIASEDYPQAYLEILAIDPEAPPPGRARWFGLDTLDLNNGPRLLHWVARSTMLDMHRWGLITIGLAPGDPVSVSRETPAGLLQWQLTLRPDGTLQGGGAVPTLIQWQGPHPADAMPDRGVRLKALTLNGLSSRARDVLRARGVALATDAQAPALQALLSTPKGDVLLQSA